MFSTIHLQRNVCGYMYNRFHVGCPFNLGLCRFVTFSNGSCCLDLAFGLTPPSWATNAYNEGEMWWLSDTEVILDQSSASDRYNSSFGHNYWQVLIVLCFFLHYNTVIPRLMLPNWQCFLYKGRAGGFYDGLPTKFSFPGNPREDYYFTVRECCC